jgi:hypothetical protein
MFAAAMARWLSSRVRNFADPGAAERLGDAAHVYSSTGGNGASGVCFGGFAAGVRTAFAAVP